MSKTDQGSSGPAWLILTLLLGVTALYPALTLTLVLTGLLPKGGILTEPLEKPQVVGAAFLLTGLASTAASFPVKKKISATLTQDFPPARQRFVGTLVAMAMSESAGVLGVVFALFTGDIRMPCLLWGISLGSCLLHYPRVGALDDNARPKS